MVRVETNTTHPSQFLCRELTALFSLGELSHEVVHRECGLYHMSLPSEKSAFPVSPAQENQVNPIYSFMYLAEFNMLSAAMEVIAPEAHGCSASVVS